MDDVILELDGRSIDSDTHLVGMIGLTEVGKKVPVTVWRKGEKVIIEVTLSARNQFEKK
ncbi:MAG: PDZ domain-containing protein [Pirellulales bacterium]